MPTVNVIQYMLPRGRPVTQYVDVSQQTFNKWHQLLDHELRLEAEVPTTGQVSLTITHEDYGDVAMSVGANDDKTTERLEKMVNDFDIAAWLNTRDTEEA